MEILKSELELRVFVDGLERPVTLTFQWSGPGRPTSTLEDFLEGCGGIHYDELVEAIEHRLGHLIRIGKESLRGCGTCEEIDTSSQIGPGGKWIMKESPNRFGKYGAVPWAYGVPSKQGQKPAASAATPRSTPKDTGARNTTPSAKKRS